MEKSNIILASSSPRRIEMMREHGIDPVIIKPSCSETLPPGTKMEDAVLFLSLKKALSVEQNFLADAFLQEKTASPHPYIIAADTIVYQNGIIGKPKDKEDAFAILRRLAASDHFVATGVTILQVGLPLRRSFCEITKVTFRDYTDEMLLRYIHTDEPYDKAGGYAIQGTFGQYVERIEGDRNNVIGFPWNRISAEFADLTGHSLSQSTTTAGFRKE